MKTEIERYTFRERICHWTTGFSYLYCLCTGLALYSPHLFWMALALGGGATSRFWHPLIGLGFFACAMWMHAIWRTDMNFTDADRRWMKHVKDYVENRDELMVPAGRFNAGQKQFYWMMFYGAAALLVSGVVMWFPELVPSALFWIRPLMTVIHEAAALVTIGAFFIHIYMGIFLVPGGLRGILTGFVPKEWAKAHHELWYKTISEK
jgi:formate dehydrogenase subunit gamma